MPQNIPMPDQLSFFLMIGNDMAEMADHIASSVKDHCFSPDDLSIRCISLVDDSFDLQESDDRFLFMNVTRTKKSKSSGGSSARDESHGGGGGSF